MLRLIFTHRVCECVLSYFYVSPLGDIVSFDVRYPNLARSSFATQSEVIDSMAVNNNKLITASDDGVVRIYDAALGSHLQTLPCHTDGVTAMSIAANWLITGMLLLYTSMNNSACMHVCFT